MTPDEKLREIRKVIGRHVRNPAYVEVFTELLAVLDAPEDE
jgi:hypothetical protein